MAKSLQAALASVNSLGALTATGTTSAIALPIADVYSIAFSVTAASGTSPTMDVVMQVSYDKGTTYVNAPLRSAQITAAGIHWNTMRRGLGWGEAASTQAGVADTGGAVNKNFVFDPAYVKFKYTIGGTSPSFTTSILVFADPLGRNENG